MANPCEYYIGKKKFNEDELKAYLAKGALDRFIDENAIDLSKFKYEAAPKEEGAKILPISEPPTETPTEVNIPEGADENYIKMANVVNDAFVGRVTEVNSVQFLNAESPIVVTELGIVIDPNDVQL